MNEASVKVFIHDWSIVNSEYSKMVIDMNTLIG